MFHTRNLSTVAITLFLSLTLAGCIDESSGEPLVNEGDEISTYEIHFTDYPDYKALKIAPNGTIFEEIYPEIILAYNQTITCAAEIEYGLISIISHGSCDTSDLEGRPWETSFVLDNQSVMDSDPTLVRTLLTWGENQGFGEKFTFCYEQTATHELCERFNTPGPSKSDQIAMIGHDPQARWQQTGEFDAWIKFSPCLPTVTCVRPPTIAMEWEISLRILHYPTIGFKLLG
jgi:hypothetical protein